ncbi:hypothetical protein GIS00_08525 [Nakamurella sp. YIM 132087]|uniref:Uncharacterized protein n=1 Tax=Nakamurella alba TaxID=2665158 RepID=A0A7K1FIN5_9ACTN|nr:hypothetical protein [Nakamurella alba]MTD13987.1 hypothetical protein [Nakamurella alba]
MSGTDLLYLALFVAGYGLLVGLLVVVYRAARCRRTGGDVLGAFDEIWHPAAVAPRIEIRVQDQRGAPGRLPAGLGDRAEEG